MTTSRFLFNDYFRKELDGQTGGWGIAYKASDASDGNILHTLRDGRIYTSQNFIRRGSVNALLYITDDLPYQVCDTVGLVNTNLIGAELAIGQSERSRILAPNHILRSPQDSGAANVFVDATPSVTVGSIALMFIGCAHDFAAYYPVGWKPPWYREYDTEMMVSDTGYPLAIHRSQVPVEYSVPVKFVQGENDRQRLQTLLYRMQSENFLFQWDINDPLSIVYAWAQPQGKIKIIAPELVSVDINIRGYTSYVN